MSKASSSSSHVVRPRKPGLQTIMSRSGPKPYQSGLVSPSK